MVISDTARMVRICNMLPGTWRRLCMMRVLEIFGVDLPGPDIRLPSFLENLLQG